MTLSPLPPPVSSPQAWVSFSRDNNDREPSSSLKSRRSWSESAASSHTSSGTRQDLGLYFSLDAAPDPTTSLLLAVCVIDRTLAAHCMGSNPYSALITSVQSTSSLCASIIFKKMKPGSGGSCL